MPHTPDTELKWTQLGKVKMLLKAESFIKMYVLVSQKRAAEPARERGNSASTSRSFSTRGLCAGTFTGRSCSQARVHTPWGSTVEGRVG